MKKAVFWLVALSFALPLTSFADDELSTSGEVESSSSATVTQNSKKERLKISTTDSSSTETSSSPVLNAYSDLIQTTLVVFQGETITPEMLVQDGAYHGATFRDLTLLEEASTEKIGTYLVKVSFMLYPLEESQEEKQEVTLNMEYTVIKPTSTYDIQFIFYDSDNKQVKGRVLSTDGSSISNVTIYGENTANNEVTPKSVKEFYPFAKSNNFALTDNDGYFTLPYQDHFNFMAFSPQAGNYSPVYTLTDQAFASASGTTDSSILAKNTESSSATAKKEEKKKASFPNTGEKRTVYLSIGGIAIILFAILFLFIKSKKNNQ
ncbi:hypothetical protein BCR24_04145 [Enterococcus ureilyticus]|uniref:Gram-positive cocci surface proteins LPxTG domain-containing protein n=1 Tax=Enterococcus ureilyticus TaxID=1131292 RepID=A0A1E5HBL0_9ENTE|nr:LPXTG cell wall anchor domain-containing protein [Enterococcus ureilyticus]MBM7689129.1 LPXTG-motif cell wall-anchored protein [Enterococcus ureilyticus]OEG22328.1 hypothetical protein BCR24_04145 [Enterococcus ureilyticus]